MGWHVVEREGGEFALGREAECRVMAVGFGTELASIQARLG